MTPAAAAALLAEGPIAGELATEGGLLMPCAAASAACVGTSAGEAETLDAAPALPPLQLPAPAPPPDPPPPEGPGVRNDARFLSAGIGEAA